MSILERVTKGIKQRPFFIGIHGPAGVGKTTFASNSPNPIFLVTEDGGADFIDTSRVEIKNFKEMLDALYELRDKKNHDFKTVVVDSIDHFEKMIHTIVASDHNKKSIEGIGFAKGYIFALEYWDQFLFNLRQLRNNGMNIILIAHSHVKRMDDPVVGESYDRYELKLHRKASDFITESMDALLFAKNEVVTSKDSATKKVTALGDGTRVLYTETRPAFDAKNRYGLPLEMPLSWDEFSVRALRSEAEKTKELTDKIWVLMEKIEDESFYNTVSETMDKFKNNVPRLEEILTKLQRKVGNGTTS
jgi:GTPase SAR1 family protein